MDRIKEYKLEFQGIVIEDGEIVKSIRQSPRAVRMRGGED